MDQVAEPARNESGAAPAAARADAAPPPPERSIGQLVLHVVALLLLLLCLMPPDGVLSDNEEDYFALAAHAVASKVPPNTAIHDVSRHRVVADLLLGSLVAAAGYERTQMITRSLAAVAFALLLGILFRRAGLTPVDTVLVILLFALAGQTLMGGEWLFNGFEAKVVAYLFVLAGLALATGRPSLRATVAVFALATYFHFLVGSFWFVAVLAGRLVADRREFRQVARAAALYLLAVAPLFALIAWTRFADARMFLQPVDLPTPDQIYSIIREPWHGAPFLSRASFVQQWLPGTIAAVIMLAACLLVARAPQGRPWRATALWLAGLLAYLLLALAASYAARRSGVLGKFYLFRPASLILLLWLAFAMAGLAARRLPRWNWVRLAAVAVLAPLFLTSAAGRLIADRQHEAMAGEKSALASALAENAAPDSVVLIDPDIEWSFLDFERRTGYPTLVTFKFMPTSDPEIIDWYRRIEFRRSVFALGCPRYREYPMDFLLTTPDRAAALVGSCGEAIYATDHFALWRVAR